MEMHRIEVITSINNNNNNNNNKLTQLEVQWTESTMQEIISGTSITQSEESAPEKNNMAIVETLMPVQQVKDRLTISTNPHISPETVPEIIQANTPIGEIKMICTDPRSDHESM